MNGGSQTSAAAGAPGRLVKQTAGPHLQRLWLSWSGEGPDDVYFSQVPGHSGRDHTALEKHSIVFPL